MKKRYLIPAAILWLVSAWLLRDLPSEGPHVNAQTIGPQNWLQAESVAPNPDPINYRF